MDLPILSQLKHVPLERSGGYGHPYSIDSSDIGDLFPEVLSQEEVVVGQLGTSFLGSITPRLDDLGGVSSPTPHSNFWQICDGGLISTGLFDGENAPSLNEVFLRAVTGATGGTGGSSSHSHSVYQSGTQEGDPEDVGGYGDIKYMLGDQASLSTTSENHLPPYYEVELWVRK